MQKLFSNQDKKLLSQVDKSEKNLQQLICDNWKTFFPEYVFITQEFSLKGTVHPSGSSGRIDILAYNPAMRRFVIFELKKNFDKNVGHQAADYRHYVMRNFSAICLDTIQTHHAELPNKSKINDKEVEVILVAKKFNSSQFSQAKTDNLVTLIEYNWFENDLLLLDYIYYAAPDTKSASPQTAQQKTKEVDKIWKRIQKGTETRENNAAKITNTVKSKKVQAFLHIVHECIATKDAKKLLNAATQPHRPFYVKNATLILDLEQNLPDKKENS